MEKVILRRLLNKGIEKLRTNFNHGLALIGLGKTWPSIVIKRKWTLKPNATCSILLQVLDQWIKGGTFPTKLWRCVARGITG